MEALSTWWGKLLNHLDRPEIIFLPSRKHKSPYLLQMWADWTGYFLKVLISLVLIFNTSYYYRPTPTPAAAATTHTFSNQHFHPSVENYLSSNQFPYPFGEFCRKKANLFLGVRLNFFILLSLLSSFHNFFAFSLTLFMFLKTGFLYHHFGGI